MTDYEEKFHSMGTPINRCVGTKGDLPDVPVVEGLQAMLPQWDIHPVADDELEAVLELMKSNSALFEQDGRPATMENLLHDRVNLPPRCIPDQKHYVAFWRNGRPEVLMDLIVGYPRERTLFIGTFMVAADLHRQGIGREIMTAMPKAADGAGMDDIRLACFVTNESGHAFWQAMGFQDLREGTLIGGGNPVWIMERLAGN
jgi:GNAT superfamily N-acetyltransferase